MGSENKEKFFFKDHCLLMNDIAFSDTISAADLIHN